MKIGIYGGSFDPIHKGHIQIAKDVISELGLDKLLIVPTYQSPFKNKSGVKTEDKINMINLVLEDKMELCLFEAKRNNISYTIDTVKYLKNKYKNDELYLIIGSDNLPKLNKWKDIETISTLTKIVVVRRSRTINKLNLKRYNGVLLKNKLYDYSSTDFKKGFSIIENEKVFSYLDPKVMNYIQEKGLYLFEIIHNSLSARRAKHSSLTASFAAEIAKLNGVSALKAYKAGILHDIAKEWSVENSRNFIKMTEPELIDTPKHFLHQVCGYLWAKYVYGIKDLEILNSIKYHTSMRKDMNTLDKIIILSDKVNSIVHFKGVQRIKKLAYENLDQAFREVIKITYQWNIDKGVIFDKEIESIYQEYIRGEN
ncbi:nicotinate-nucleotide adenylyltransferase [Mycoplasma sp. CSL10137]|uniref:nicotinate-nucleotide adenylyltransferase n=1 Tax=Mycoplasma sp. CSL10137 TaxID=2813824 RepID=UPI00197CA21F|nr:nicotinate-nucleotide adenylyltransferase [Mycoplasma sp. CSL10137]MBN4083301.1 nicotinate-nucleotide adenylyltransferase [Mycoplasma sp. CSL10137]